MDRYVNHLYVCDRAAGDNIALEDHAYMFPANRVILAHSHGAGEMKFFVENVKNDAGFITGNTDGGQADVIELQYNYGTSDGTQADYLAHMAMLDELVAACNNVTKSGFTTLADVNMGEAFGLNINPDLVTLDVK
jgi:hypothetical protein